MYKTQNLKNGLKLITVPMRGTKTVTVLVMVGTGSKYENKKNNGISHFLEHMFFKGTKKWPTALALSSELDGIGAEFNAFTGKEYTGYWVKCDGAKLETALEVVSDMYFNSRLDKAEVEREKGVIIEELNMYRDNPMMYIEDIYENLLYGNTPAGWDTIGTKSTIKSFNRGTFTEYLLDQYTLGNTCIFLSGDVPPCHSGGTPRLRGADRIPMSDMKPRDPIASLQDDKVIKLAEKYFGGKDLKTRNGQFREKLAVKESQTCPQIKMHYKKTDQAHISLGVRTCGYADKDLAAIKMISLILGGAMSSRLFINLRERQGLAYYVRTEAEFYTDSGYLTTRAGVPVDKVDTAIKIILKEYARLTKELVSAKELNKIKDMLTGRLHLQLEASDDLANWYGRQVILLDTIARTDKKSKKKAETPDEFLKEIRRIKPADLKKIAKKIFVNKGLNLAVIGPYKNTEKFKKLLRLNS